MAKHAVIRTDLMAGTEDYGQLKSVKFCKSSSPAAIDNGNLGHYPKFCVNLLSGVE